MQKKLNIRPRAHLMKSFRVNSHLSFKLCLEEIFDNSSDAGADLIEVTLDEDQLIITDNGRGVRDLEALIALGGHESTDDDDDTIGRYGVGFNDAAMWISRCTVVETCNGLFVLKTTVPWFEIDDDWTLTAIERPAKPGQPTYTRLVFSELDYRRVKFTGRLLADIAYDFTPGLRRGLSITIDGEPLMSAEDPALSDRIVIDDFLGGRHFKLTAGLRADNKEPDRFGYDVAYKDRLLLRQDSRRAFGDYSPQRFYGYLELLRDGQLDWTLGKNKQWFEEREELYDYLFPRIEPLLIKSDQMGEDLQFRNQENEASSILSKAFTKFIKEKRQKPERRPPVPDDPDDFVKSTTERKRRKAKKVDPEDQGSVAADPNAGHIQVKLDYEHPDNLGYVNEGTTHTIVHLNPKFPFNFRDSRFTLVMTAASFYVNYWVHLPQVSKKDERQTVIAFGDPALSFVAELSKMLREAIIEADAKGKASGG